MADDKKSQMLAELRRQQHLRYMSVPQEEKPHVDPCADCGELPFRSSVCPATGLYHELEKKKQHLIGGKVIHGKVIESHDLMEGIDRTIVRWVDSRTRLVRVDSASISIFETFVAQMDWNMQRYGILYGKYDTTSATIEVHAIYEPEQIGRTLYFTEKPDPRIVRVDAIAAGLGLRRVGLVCTQPPRNQDQVVLSGQELLLCAREQSRFGDECVLLALAPDQTDGTVSCHAWQASPQCVELFRLGQLHVPETRPGDKERVAEHEELRADPEYLRHVYADLALEVAEDRKDDKGRMVSHHRDGSHWIDTRWFTSYVAIEQFESPVVRSRFARISRPGLAPPTFANLRAVLQSPERAGQPFAVKIADFHILIFLAECFSMTDDMPAILRIVSEGVESPQSKNYEMLLESYMSQNK